MGLRSMADRYRRPDWVRQVNAMGPAAGGAGRMVPLDASSLIDDAGPRPGCPTPATWGTATGRAGSGRWSPPWTAPACTWWAGS